MNRRNFLQLSGAATAGAAITMLSPAAAKAFISDPCQNPAILPGYIPSITSAWIAQGTQASSYAIFAATIEAATDFSWLAPGDSVFLKLALNSGNANPATTDPWAVQCMIQLLLAKGAGKVFVGDQSGAEYVIVAQSSKRGSSRTLCSNAGLLSVITANGAQPIFFDEYGYNAYSQIAPPTPNHWPTSPYVTNCISQFDHIIYMPRVGSHILADFSAGMKIAIGFLRDDSRCLLHKAGTNFYAMYEEVSQIPQIKSKLRLVVSSGMNVLTTCGPDSGYVSTPNYGLLFASTDLLAHDAMSYAWLQWNYAYNTPSNDQTAPPTNTGRAMVNSMFVSMFFNGVAGYNNTTSSLPANTCLPNVYTHRAMANYVARIGGRPAGFNWTQITQNPDASVPRFMLGIMNG